MDIISRLPGCDGQAADAVSAQTQVKMEDAHKLLKIPKIRTSRHLYSSTPTQMAEVPVSKTESFLLNEICTVILWQDSYGQSNLRKSYKNTVGRRFPIGSVFSYTVKKDYSYLCMWMTQNWLERNKTLIRCGKYSTKKSILGEPTSFLDHVYLGCTQRPCEISKDIVVNYRTMFESRISAGENRKASIL